MKILFLVPYPTEGPSNRYRVEQYLPYLKAANIDYTLRPFASARYYKIFYKKERRLLKIMYFFQGVFGRLLDVFRAFNHDIIFIHIEAFPIGPPFMEWFFFKMKKPVIFDFEDAIYLPRKNIVNNLFKNPTKFFKIVKMSKHIIICNNYLKDFLFPYNSRVTVIPTSIDTDKFQPPIRKVFDREKVVIGWIGSHTTLPLLLELKDVFRSLAQRHSFALKIIGGGKDVNIDGIEVINEEWILDREIKDFQSLDIGVYPLPDNEWSKAKTPFKTIQYMSVGVPVVASRVAGNRDIIQDGINGFLASSDEEWIEKISKLIVDPELRKRIGFAGRKSVEEKFSLKINAPKYVEIIKNIYK